MTYAQAKSIGSNLEGYVKCTYAIIWTKPVDEKENRFFAFQQYRRNPYVQYADDGVGYQPIDNDYIIGTQFSFPLFEEAGEPDPANPNFIPIKLTKWAYNVLVKAVRHPSHKAGINIDTIWYVKDCAVAWMPTNIKNATVVVNGKEILLKDALAQAEADIEKKKKLLIAAGAATLIL